MKYLRSMQAASIVNYRTVLKSHNTLHGREKRVVNFWTRSSGHALQEVMQSLCNFVQDYAAIGISHQSLTLRIIWVWVVHPSFPLNPSPAVTSLNFRVRLGRTLNNQGLDTVLTVAAQKNPTRYLVNTRSVIILPLRKGTQTSLGASTLRQHWRDALVESL